MYLSTLLCNTRLTALLSTFLLDTFVMDLFCLMRFFCHLLRRLFTSFVHRNALETNLFAPSFPMTLLSTFLLDTFVVALSCLKRVFCRLLRRLFTGTSFVHRDTLETSLFALSFPRAHLTALLSTFLLDTHLSCFAMFFYLLLGRPFTYWLRAVLCGPLRTGLAVIAALRTLWDIPIVTFPFLLTYSTWVLLLLLGRFACTCGSLTRTLLLVHCACAYSSLTTSLSGTWTLIEKITLLTEVVTW
jgi:hypothetical protein